MKNKFSSMWRVGIALVMVLSLGLMAAPVSAAEPAALTVTITQPTTGSDIAKGETFTVTAKVENTGGTKATDVQATIAITAGEATPVPPLTLPVTPVELAVGAIEEVTWEVACDAVGDVTIEVTPAGEDWSTGLAIPEAYLTPATVTVSQVDIVPILTVDIIEPADLSNVSVGQEFTVTAVVINTGFATTTDAVPTATIATTGAVTVTGSPTLVHLAIGQSDEATWTVTIDGVGAVTIEVTPAGQYGGDATSIPDTNLSPDSIDLTAQLPAALEVTAITAPGTVKVGAEFVVTATVKSTGEATATDVTATVEVGTTTAEVATLVNAGNGVTTEFVFSLTPKVVASSLVITPEADIKSIAIDWETGELTVTYEAAPGTEAVPIDILANYTCFTADAVDGLAKVVSDIPAKLGTLAGAAETEATFTLLCLDVGDAFIRVNLTGEDANTEAVILGVNLQPLSATVAQKEAAVLEVTITPLAAVDVGDEITVKATVTNTGMATARDVTLTLSIDANAALAEGEAATQTVGYLATGITSSEVTWKVDCTAAGKSKITVTPSGTDVLTGAAILAGSLKDASVTVLQSVTTETITLVAGWNLISLPLIPTDPSIDTALADLIDVEQVRTFESDLSEKWWIPDVAASTLGQMVDGRGYWVEMSAVDDLIAAGVDFALPGGLPPTYDVVVGWNLIGFTSTTHKPLPEYLGAVEGTIQAIYGYEAGAYFIPKEFVEAESDTGLEVGYGYWLAVNAAGTIYP